nr:MAG TPA: hypothetical protein [Caudoviricetes sp.]
MLIKGKQPILVQASQECVLTTYPFHILFALHSDSMDGTLVFTVLMQTLYFSI